MAKKKSEKKMKKTYHCRFCEAELDILQIAPAGMPEIRLPFGGILKCENRECDMAGFLTIAAVIKEVEDGENS